ncbi:MAG: hypothetical protein ABEL04_00950 [Salinibacter sp.]|uniref:hypothetical protein n=1 Tax=Salinibacter sp. TaxID=2065818 RepID=UPI0035D4FAA1
MNITTQDSFRDEEVILDYHKYVNCTFEDCVIVYYGSGPTAADNCQFEECQFDFRDPASSVFNTLRSFFHGGLEEVAVDVLATIVAPDEETSPLRVLEGDQESRLVLDLGRVDPDDLGVNGRGGSQ